MNIVSRTTALHQHRMHRNSPFNFNNSQTAAIYQCQLFGSSSLNHRRAILNVSFHDSMMFPEKQFWLTETRRLFEKVDKTPGLAHEFLCAFNTGFDSYLLEKDMQQEFVYIRELLQSMCESIEEVDRDKQPAFYKIFAKELKDSGYLVQSSNTCYWYQGNYMGTPPWHV